VRADTADWWDLHYGDWLAMVDRAYRAEHGKRPCRLLDLGCGFGYFSRAALREGYVVEAIDPNPDAIEEAWRVLASWDPHPSRPDFAEIEGRVVIGLGTNWRLDRIDYRALNTRQTFDVVSALWVMEHLIDPEGFLERARSALRDGGVLLIAVPNDFSQAQYRANPVAARPNWWIDRTHINYWTPSTLANLLGRFGFRIVDQTTMYPMERFIYADEKDYTADPILGAKLHAEVRADDAKNPTRAQYYQYLASIGEGRELIIVAVKGGIY
jgi:2-polyprenyl-3-methyl-5-hydroxy-6-metoxy-1,4-benzoquinol methylase